MFCILSTSASYRFEVHYFPISLFPYFFKLDFVMITMNDIRSMYAVHLVVVVTITFSNSTLQYSGHHIRVGPKMKLYFILSGRNVVCGRSIRITLLIRDKRCVTICITFDFICPQQCGSARFFLVFLRLSLLAR